MATAETCNASATDTGARGFDASGVHDVARLVLGAVRVWRRHPRVVDADCRIEAEWRDGTRVRRDHGARIECGCRLAGVSLARGKAEVHVVGEGICNAASDWITADAEYRCNSVGPAFNRAG